MKKRVLSALLVLCMACSMVSTVWATETNATSGAPEPASQTLNLDNEQSGNESGADSTDAPSDSTDSTSASSDSTSSGSSSAASDAASDATSGAVSDATSGEGDESAASSDSTAASDSTSSSSSASSDSSDSDADDPNAASSDVTGDESGTGTEEEDDPVAEEPSASPEPVPSQPNSAPAAAAPALQAETRATANTFHITWDNYFDVTVHYVDQYGSPIDYNFGCQDQTLTENKTLTFRNFVTVDKIETDTGTYTYDAAHYGSPNGSNVTSVSASQSSFMGTTTRKFDFGSVSLEHNTYPFIGGEGTKTADVYLVYNFEEFQPEELPEGALSIEETVAQDGMFTAVFEKGTLQDGDTVTYRWEVSRTGVQNTWQTVESQKVTGENFNWRPDVDPEKINVAFDSLLRNVTEDQRYYYRVTATVTHADETTDEYKAQQRVPYYIQLQNGSFETPDITTFNNQMPNGTAGLIWYTTGPGSINGKNNQDIEIILEGFNDTQSNYGVNVASDGEQFAELNCEAYGALYQDVMTVPGTTLNWRFDHLARQLDDQSYRAEDTMAMVIMPADQADEVAQELQEAATTYRNNPVQAIQEIKNILNGLEGRPGCYVYEATDGTYNAEKDWQTHKSTADTAYTVPEDQYLTRFFFVSVDAAYDHRNNADKTKYGTVGNLIDNVWFSTHAQPPANDEAQLTVAKTVTGLSEEEMADYSVTLQISASGADVQTVTFSGDDFQPDASGSYTASRTFNYTVQANTGSKTVTVSETQPQVPGYTVGTSYAVTGAAAQNGTDTQTEQFTIPARQNVTVTFTNTYTPTTTDLTITKTFVGLDEETANQVWGSIGFTTGDNTATKNSDRVTSGGDGTFTATATISGLTIGQAYTITETGAMVDSYTLKTTATGVDGEQEVTEGTPPHASIDALIAGATVNFTNTYTRQTGTLVLNKDIAGLPTLPKDDQEKVNALIYNFIITGPADAVDVVAVDNDGDDNDIVFVANGDGGATATVPVAVGTNVRIENLPTGPYTVTEVLPSAEAPNSNYEILDGKYYFDETVADNGNSWSGNLTKTGATATITNTYAPYYTVTVTKQVGGAMGSSEETFTFTSEQINGLNANNITIADGSKASLTESGFTMKAGGSLTVNKVKNSTHFSIVEVKAEGYVTTVTIDGANNTAGTDAPTTAYFTVGEEDVTVTYQNDRAAVAPTGLESNHTTPYVLMITAAGMAGLALIGGIVARRIRRRRQE